MSHIDAQPMQVPAARLRRGMRICQLGAWWVIVDTAAYTLDGDPWVSLEVRDVQSGKCRSHGMPASAPADVHPADTCPEET